MRAGATKSNPITMVIGLVAAAGVFVGAILLAMHLQGDSPRRAPFLGVVVDEGSDTLRVVEPDTSQGWDQFAVRTDIPALVALSRDPGNRTLSPGGEFVRLEHAIDVSGGDGLSVCSLGLPGSARVLLKDTASETIVVDRVLDVAACGQDADAVLGQLAASRQQP